MWSVSKVECFEKCPYQYKLRYIDDLTTLDECLADNPLKVGTFLHESIEIGFEKAKANYFAQFPVITNEMETQAMIIEILSQKAKKVLPCGKYEHKVVFYDFIGFIDLLVNTQNEHCNIYDFKFCGKSSKDRYLQDSPQLMAYKYYLEGSENLTVDNLYYCFVQKPIINEIQGEDIIDYRWRIKQECEKLDVEIVKVDYETSRLARLVSMKKIMEHAKSFEKKQSALCSWCEFQDYCYKGENYMILPKAQREINAKKNLLKIWLYGSPYSGKTYIADKFPMPIQLNTDGNTKQTTAPVVAIKDEITMHGKAKQVKFAWEVFKEAIEELEKGSEFKTIVVDLIENIYESCRLYMYDKLNITHESDDSFRAWDKVRLEFLSTIRKLTNLDYNIVLISQEDTSRDITKKGGEKLSTITPCLQEKIANKVAGMVDVTARCVHDETGYKIVFNTNETQFGGTRMKIEKNEIVSTIDNLFNACGLKLDVDTILSNNVSQNTPQEQEPVVEKNNITAEKDIENVVATEQKPVAVTRKTRRVKGE